MTVFDYFRGMSSEEVLAMFIGAISVIFISAGCYCVYLVIRVILDSILDKIEERMAIKTAVEDLKEIAEDKSL